MLVGDAVNDVMPPVKEGHEGATVTLTVFVAVFPIHAPLEAVRVA